MKNIKNNKSLNYVNIAGTYVIFLLLIFSCSQEKIFNIIPNESQLLDVEFQVREKIITLSDSLSKYPNDIKLLADYAMTLDAHDFHFEAEKLYSILQQIDYTDFRWPLFHAIILHNLGDKKSLELYKKSMNLNNKYIPTLSLCGQAMYEHGHIDSSIFYFNKAIERQKCSKFELTYLAKIYINSNRFYKADSMLALISECDIVDKTYYSLLSELARKNNNKTLYNKLTLGLIDMPDASDMIYNPIYDQIIEKGLSSTWFRYRAQKHMETQLYELAIKEYTQLIKLKPLSEDYYNLGIAYENIGKLIMAENYFKLCLKNNPVYIQACEQLAKIYKNKGDIKKYIFYNNQIQTIRSKIIE